MITDTYLHDPPPRSTPELAGGRGGGNRGREGGSQLFESAEKGGVMKNGPLKGGGSCKCVRDHLEVTSTEESK